MINKANSVGLPILYLIMIAIVYAFNLPIPQDDLLRDLVASYYNYDYTQLYVHAPYLAQYNQYIAFDYLLHGISSLIGMVATAHLLQVLCFILFITPCILLFKHFLRGNQYTYLYLTFILMILLNDYTMLRITLARPEMIFTCWVMWGLWLRMSSHSLAKLIWFVVGVILIPTYWLAFFYVPIIFVVFIGWKRKLLMAIIYTALVALFWQCYSHYQWITSILDLGKLNSNRLAIIGENKTIIKLLLTPITSIAAVSYVYTFKQSAINLLQLIKQDYRHTYQILLRKFKNINYTSDSMMITYLILCYCSINMIRYSALISALCCMVIIIRLNKLQIIIPSIYRYIALVLAIFMPLTIGCYSTAPKFTIPSGSIVLASNLSNYYVPFYSPGVKIAPAMEIGANTKEIQQLLRNLDISGSIDCSILRKNQFTYVVEKNMTHIPSCLQIYQVQKGWRAWKVIY